MTASFNSSSDKDVSPWGNDSDAQQQGVFSVLTAVQKGTVAVSEDLSISAEHNPFFDELNDSRKNNALDQAELLIQHAKFVGLATANQQLDEALDKLFEMGNADELRQEHTKLLARDGMTVAYLHCALEEKLSNDTNWTEAGQFLYECTLCLQDFIQAVERQHEYEDETKLALEGIEFN